MKKNNRKKFKIYLKALRLRNLLNSTELGPFLKYAKEVADLRSCGSSLKTLVFF